MSELLLPLVFGCAIDIASLGEKEINELSRQRFKLMKSYCDKKLEKTEFETECEAIDDKILGVKNIVEKYKKEYDSGECECINCLREKRGLISIDNYMKTNNIDPELAIFECVSGINDLWGDLAIDKVVKLIYKKHPRSLRRCDDSSIIHGMSASMWKKITVTRII